MTKLNDLYYNACVEYSQYLRYGHKTLKENSEKYMLEYKNRGGKKEVKYIK